MNLFGISSVLLFFASIGFGISLYESDKKSPVSKSWLLASFSIAFWGLGLFILTSNTNKDIAIWGEHLIDVSSAFIPIAYFIFAQKLVGTDYKKINKFGLTVACGIAILSFTSLYKIGISDEKFGFFWIEPGPYYFIFPVYFVIFIVGAILILVKKYTHTKDLLQKAQLRNTGIAAIIGATGGFTNFFPQLFDVFPFGNYFVILYVFFMTYGVLRYKLISKKIVAAQLFAGALNIVLLFNVLQSESLNDWITKIVILILGLFFGYQLVISVYQEVKTREQIEKLAKDLEETNNNLTVANARLKELDQLKSEFVSLATHQIRSPLAAVRGYASMVLEGDYGRVSAKVRGVLETIVGSTESLLTIVNDFLDISRIEQGRMKYDMKDFDMKELVSTTVKDLLPNVKQKKLEIDFTYDTSSTYKTYGDYGKIKQIIGNLIDNAIKYTPEGWVRVHIKKNDHMIRTEISDSGVGIRESEIPKLFNKFTRAKDANETNVTGTGLGLYVARNMIEAHQGKIWVESKGLGKGSVFIVELKAK